MVNAHAGSSRNEPVQVVHMSVGHDPRGLASDSPLTIVAELDPAPDWEELQWWTGQLGEHVTVRGWSATSTDGVTTIQIEAAEGQLEAVARRLLAARMRQTLSTRNGMWSGGASTTPRWPRIGSSRSDALPIVRRFLTG